MLMGIDRGRLRARPFLRPLQHVFFASAWNSLNTRPFIEVNRETAPSRTHEPGCFRQSRPSAVPCGRRPPEHGGINLSGETYEQIIPNGQPGSRERFPPDFDDRHNSRQWCGTQAVTSAVDDLARRVARPAQPHGDKERLRSRPMRRLHGPGRRAARQLVPDLGRHERWR